MEREVISVIVAAHNEEAVISRTLVSLTDGAAESELDVIVVCNGCTDNTAEVARRFGPPVRVIQTDIASKSHALNLGDQAAARFPRFYVDADVAIRLADIRRLAARLRQGDVLAAAPRPIFDVAGCAWAVRAYYDIHMRLPASYEGIGGSGVYAMSEDGRRRFGEFPHITADDGFVRLQFRPDERVTLESCRSVVRAPRTLKELIAIKTRSYLGTRELKRLYPDKWANVGTPNGASLRSLARHPSLWPRLLAYGCVKLAARYRYRRMLKQGQVPRWERDESSRAVAAETSCEAGLGRHSLDRGSTTLPQRQLAAEPAPRA